jgi:hypothetical protein
VPRRHPLAPIMEFLRDPPVDTPKYSMIGEEGER